MPPKRAGSLTVALSAVHPFGISRRACNAIALAEPFQEIAILAAPAAEWCMFRLLGLTANWAGFRFFRLFRHIRQTWEGRRLPATEQCLRLALRAR